MEAPLLADGVVRLRQLVPADVDDWLAGEDEEQIRWFEFPRPATRADVERAIEEWAESWETGGPVRNWGITDATTGQLLGGVEIRDIGAAEVNLTYVVFPAHRRRGIATRASKLALDHAARELGARTAVIKILEGNAASRGVARRLDANEDGTEPSEAGGTYIVHRCRLADVSRVRR